MRAFAIAALCASALAAVGTGGAAGARTASAFPCSGKKLAGWQRLADRIQAPVYCPSWLPDPLDGVFDSRWNNIDSVSRDRSYLVSWAWQETGPGAAGGELHVNLRGYPGRTALPRCPDANTGQRLVPCFSDAHGVKRAHGIRATVYTVNQGADQWHVLYAWRRRGTLYTISEHVAKPLTYRKVVLYLDRILAGLVLVPPSR